MSVCWTFIAAVSGAEIITGQRASDSSGSALICSLISFVMRLVKGSSASLRVTLHVDIGTNDGGSARGWPRPMMRARKVALSGTSKTLERAAMTKLRASDQLVEPSGRTRQL